MSLAVGLLAHAIAFWSFVLWVPAADVSRTAWCVVYIAGALYLMAVPLFLRFRLGPRRAFKLLAYAILVAAIFFGADMALTALGNSVKPRQPLPAAVGGLALWYLLVPGVAATAFGALASGLLARRKIHTRC